MLGDVLLRLGVAGEALALADHGAGELGAEAVGVVGKLDELVRVEVDAGGGATGVSRCPSESKVRGVSSMLREKWKRADKPSMRALITPDAMNAATSAGRDPQSSREDYPRQLKTHGKL